MLGTTLLALVATAVAAGAWARTGEAADPAGTATLTVAPGVVNAGATTLAIGKISSRGPSSLTQAVATFTLPAGSAFVPAGSPAPASSAGCTAAGTTVTCAVTGPLQAGETRTFFVVFAAPATLGYASVGLTATFKEQSSSGSSQRPPTTITAAPQALEIAAAADSRSVNARCTTSTSLATDPSTGEVSTDVLLLAAVGGLPCNPIVARERPKTEVASCTKALITCTGEVPFVILPALSRVTVKRFVPPGYPLVQPAQLPVWELNDELDETPTAIPPCPLVDGSPRALPLGAPTDSCTTGITRSGRTYTISLLVNGTGVDPGIAG